MKLATFIAPGGGPARAGGVADGRVTALPDGIVRSKIMPMDAMIEFDAPNRNRRVRERLEAFH